MSAENKPGIVERGSFILRNAGIVASAIFVFFGHMGAAAIAAAGAVIDHAAGRWLKNNRLKSSHA